MGEIMQVAWDVMDSIRKDVVFGPERPANSFTVVDYINRYAIPETTAKDQLRRFVRDGRLLTKKCVIEGHVVNVYWIP
jgi:hypothetical protein